MKAELEERLKAICKAQGYGDDKGDLKEMLIDAKEVWEGDDDQHRWMIHTTRVVELDNMFVSYAWGKCTGDNSMEDAGFEWDWDSVCRVMRKEVKTIVYVPINEAEETAESR